MKKKISLEKYKGQMDARVEAGVYEVKIVSPKLGR